MRGANIATLTARLGEYSRALQTFQSALAEFTRDPLFKSSSGIPAGARLNELASALPSKDDLRRIVDEITAEAQRAAELQQQVDQF